MQLLMRVVNPAEITYRGSGGKSDPSQRAGGCRPEGAGVGAVGISRAQLGQGGIKCREMNRIPQCVALLCLNLG